jgi:flagellar operon protein
MTSGPILYPNVGSIPGKVDVDTAKGGVGKSDGAPGEFEQTFEKALGQVSGNVDLQKVRQPLKFSAHALQRLQDRKIALDQPTLSKVNSAVDQAASKGVQDTLVLTKDAALIISVKNRTVVTAMDRHSMDGNVFTNIDGAVII